MNICILGWYGTETLGDRSILDGIIKLFEAKESGNSYFLGSLIPFFSERTVYQDQEYYSAGNKTDITVFCEKEIAELKKYVLLSDYVIMGGGPLMDISEILIIRKAFRLARKNNIKTGLIGCGYGPFHYDYFRSVAEDILDCSDVAIFRDEISYQRATDYRQSLNAAALGDPAVVSALYYRENAETRPKQYIAVNFRDTRFKAYKDKIIDVMEELYIFTKDIAETFPEVVMVPMHTFFWGGDDRSYFAEMFMGRQPDNVKILYEPQSIYELYETYAEAAGCVGMRYHSVILQTILNGNNIILDYTEGKTGKISGFMGTLQGGFYDDRYIETDNLDRMKNEHFISVLGENARYDHQGKSADIINKYLDVMFRND